jgi:hypothetical protein
MWPEWWDWELAFTGHAELRMMQRSVTELVRCPRNAPPREWLFAQRRTRAVHGRNGQHGQPWIVIVEPDFEERVLVIVTAYERGR